MTDATEIARVAAGLTKLQVLALSTQCITQGKQSYAGGTHATVSRLRSKGLVMDRAGTLTIDGKAVRDHILREKSGG